MIWIKSGYRNPVEHEVMKERVERDRKDHWEGVYRENQVHQTSWHQEVPEQSLALIAETGLGKAASILDIGGGASLLVDCLLDRGYGDVTVLDIALAALEQGRERLGDRAAKVRWIEADVTRWNPDRTFDIWHDRASFHFLTRAKDRQRYAMVLSRALRPGGQVVLGAFALSGPKKCSGLDIVRYDDKKISAELGPGFRLEEQRDEVHLTPAGREQDFSFFRFSRRK